MEQDRDTEPAEPAEGAAGPPRAVKPGRKARRGSGSRLLFLLVLAGLLSLVIAVIWILPRLVDPVAQLEEEEPPAATVAVEPPTESETRRARFKREAEKALEEYLKLQAAMEAQEAAVWAGDDYEAALQTLAEADVLFADEQFEQAKDRYQAAAGMLASLQESKPRRLEQALSRGAAALDRHDAGAARREFELANVIEPGNRQAVEGLDRAGKIEQVSNLLDQAGMEEEGGDLEAAQGLLQQAVALDPQSGKAREELDRISGRIETRQFNRFMSEALTAVENGRFDEAETALASAGALRPGTAEIEDARRRLDAARQRIVIDRHRSRAEQFEQTEQWHQVTRELEAVVAVDPQAQFAVQGLERSRRLAALHDQLDAWLQDPERLSSREPRENARSLLDSRPSGSDPGPRLQQKLDQVAVFVMLAETPVQVTLLSDGFTNVTVNRVGRFGAFSEKTIDLLPGRYVVRGERDGYRDVRLELSVGVGAATPALTVICEERI